MGEADAPVAPVDARREAEDCVVLTYLSIQRRSPTAWVLVLEARGGRARGADGDHLEVTLPFPARRVATVAATYAVRTGRCRESRHSCKH